VVGSGVGSLPLSAIEKIDAFTVLNVLARRAENVMLVKLIAE
jgi:hypothetical protein